MYQVLTREFPDSKKVVVRATAQSEATASRLRGEWVDRLLDDGVENPEELVLIRRK